MPRGTRFDHERLRAAVKEAGINATQLAAAAGVHAHTADNHMAGKTVPRASDLAAYASRLGRPVEDFFVPEQARTV